MNLDEWELEMCRMIDSFGNQAMSSLQKIYQRFEVLGRPFDEEFRKHFLKMSNQRLDMSFDLILFSKQKPVQSNVDEPSTSMAISTKKPLFDGTLIEINDSDDDEHSGMQAPVPIDLTADQAEIDKSIESLDSNICNQNPIDTNIIDAADVDSENEVKPSVKDEPNADEATEMVDLPEVAFDPRKENSGSKVVYEKGKNSKSHRTNTSANADSKKSNRIAAKRFRCKHCDCAFKTKYHLKQHQPIHANGRLIGLKADSNGLYHCTRCVRRFVDMAHLSKHMKSHKGNQYLYHCARCLCEFVQEAKKDRHESRCKGRHFECHLCKVFVTKLESHMHSHMRTHSGVKPFCCMVCNESFQTKFNLKKHLNRIHNRKRS